MILGLGLLVLFGQLKVIGINFIWNEFLLTMVLMFSFPFLKKFYSGVILRNFMESMNKYVALLVSALLFALMHAANPKLSLIGNINLFLAGVVLGLPYIYTKNLMFPIAFHFSWNFFQSLFGFNVSGLDSYSLI
nr:CPBP family intramembrane glutamic endopeptidase [uncultured Allomuricauda sp.]